MLTLGGTGLHHHRMALRQARDVERTADREMLALMGQEMQLLGIEEAAGLPVAQEGAFLVRVRDRARCRRILPPARKGWQGRGDRRLNSGLRADRRRRRISTRPPLRWLKEEKFGRYAMARCRRWRLSPQRHRARFSRSGATVGSQARTGRHSGPTSGSGHQGRRRMRTPSEREIRSSLAASTIRAFGR